MKFIKYLLVGIAFGIVLSKSEAISWYRIYEMFNFQSFHMYGVIGSAVVSGAIAIWIIKKWHWRDLNGEEIHLIPKKRSITRYLVGGTIFGLGWALTGACPGPMFVLVGQGYAVFGLVIFSAMIGTFFYGLIRHKLPH
jgi:uncharacterized membrane protein YedE/YeeE